MTELICIVCPKGCHLHVDEEHDFAVTGNSCARGSEYGRTEMIHPTRVLTSIVRTSGTTARCCPVKTDGGVPKKEIFAAMALLKDVTVTAPVKIGDVIVPNVCGAGVSWVATKDIDQ